MSVGYKYLFVYNKFADFQSEYCETFVSRQAAVS